MMPGRLGMAHLVNRRCGRGEKTAMLGQSTIFVTACGAVGSCEVMSQRTAAEKRRVEVLFALQRVMGGARIGPAGPAGTRGSSNLMGRDGLVRPITPDDDDDERGASEYAPKVKSCALSIAYG